MHTHSMAIQGIKYYKRTGDSKELVGVLDCNTIPVNNSIYDYIKYNSSTIEKSFTKDLYNDTGVKIFFKIPQAFKIETPLGTYNPD